MSSASRFFVAASDICPPFCNQMVMEGTGEIDLNKWKDAVREASEKNPGSRYILKGSLNSCRWVESRMMPQVREVDGYGWDGQSGEGAQFLMDKLCPIRGPACEVLIVRGDPLRVVFRTHHGVMDGMGTITWVADIFNALNGRSIRGSGSTVVENDLVNSAPVSKQKIPIRFIPGSGPPNGHGAGFVWRRKRIVGHIHNLLPQVMIQSAKEAWKGAEGNVRIGVPFDLRPRRKGLRATHNLTYVLFIDLTPEMTVDDVEFEISDRLEKKLDGGWSLGDKLIHFVPLFLLKIFFKLQIRYHNRKGRYPFTGYISNLGRLPLEKFSGGGFASDAFFFVPPGMGFLPFFLTLNGTQNHVEFVMTMPEVLASEGRIDNLLQRIASGVGPA